MLENGTMTEEEYSEVFKELKTQHFYSKLKCFNSHNGLRKGEITTVLAPKGGGKSTFIRTMVAEVLQNHKNIYTFLSEEKPNKYKIDLYRCFKNVLESSEKANVFLSRWFIKTQIDMGPSDTNPEAIEKFMNELEIEIVENNIEVFVLDNFTTSFLGRSNINTQAWCVERLKGIAVKFDIVVVLVLHTSKGTNIYDSILDGDHVRGNATSINMGSYNYILSAFFMEKVKRVFLTIDKARYHREANKKVFELIYDNEAGLYTSDIESSYDEIQKVISMRKAKQRKIGKERSL